MAIQETYNLFTKGNEALEAVVTRIISLLTTNVSIRRLVCFSKDTMEKTLKNLQSLIQEIKYYVGYPTNEEEVKSWHAAY